MSPEDKDNTDQSIDDDVEIMALEKILAEAEELEKEKAVQSNAPAKNNDKFHPELTEDDTFAEAFGYEVDKTLEKQIEKQVASTTDDLDSSDDEEMKNFLERKYNEYGCDINKKLKQQNQAAKESKADYEVDKFLREEKNDGNSGSTKSLSMHIKNPHNPIKRQSFITESFKKLPETKTILKEREIPAGKSITNPGLSNSLIYTDPVFGLRIINPLVSSTLLKERMNGRKSVAFSAVAFHTQRGDLSKDWVIAGVLVNKSPVQMSKKGQPYSIWRLSDLKGEIKTLSLFLFKGAHKELWKTAQGMCLAVLNPTIFEKRADSKDVACLSIDTAQKVMVLGQSKDLGNCKSIKRNGEVCNAIVNLSECDSCLFHIKQEFGKMSKRSELQSPNAGRGLNELRNKVLGKSEVFYGGQSFSAVPARKSAKLTLKDNSRISSLSEYAVSPFAGSINHKSKNKSMEASTIPYASRQGPVSRVAGNVEASTKQRLKDLERLKILQAESENKSQNSATNTTALNPVTVTPELVNSEPPTSSSLTVKSSSPKLPTPALSAVSEKFKNREFSFAAKSPQLSKTNFCIEVNIGEQRAQLAKMKAAQIINKKPIEKLNPNSVRGTRGGKRRAIDELNEQFMSNESKKLKVENEQREQDRKTRIQRIIEASSSHTNLVDIREREEQEKYFSKLEKKEALEEKMLNTYKMPCKAVICKICKYTAFSASDRCKEEQHPLKVVDAEKRFFQCKDCGNRTVSVFKLPKVSCKACQGSRWERCAMIRERKVCNGSESLSLRGDEEMFIGSIAGTANLNLAVPED